MFEGSPFDIDLCLTLGLDYVCAPYFSACFGVFYFDRNFSLGMYIIFGSSVRIFGCLFMKCVLDDDCEMTVNLQCGTDKALVPSHHGRI